MYLSTNFQLQGYVIIKAEQCNVVQWQVLLSIQWGSVFQMLQQLWNSFLFFNASSEQQTYSIVA